MVLPLLAGVAFGEPFGGNLAFLLREVHWVAYGPTHYYPAERPPVVPDNASIQQDLRVLRNEGFDGLITYGAAIESIPRIARELGFRPMLLGIWNPLDEKEQRKAMRAARSEPKLIAGLIVGNEGILTAPYRVADLCATMARLRSASAKPVSTTESADIILGMDRVVVLLRFCNR